MPKKKSLPASPFQDRPWPLSLEQDLANFLAMLEARFKSNMSDSLPAFEAVGYIASYVWEKGDPSPCTVPIPWWIIEALAINYFRYRDSAESGASMTLGEAYGVEGGGQGNEPRIQREMREHGNRRIALAIAFADADGIKIDAA